MVENKHIVVVSVPSMEMGVEVVNYLNCGHKLKFIVPNTIPRTVSYWFIFENFQYLDLWWFRDKLAKEYPQLKII